MDLLGPYSNWTDWTELVERLERKGPRSVAEVPVNRGIVQRLTDEQVLQLVDGYRGGARIYELAALFKIHRTTVSLHLRKQGVRR